MKEEQQMTNTTRRFILLALALALGIGIGFGAWQTGQASILTGSQATAEVSGNYQTTTVRRGDLSLSVSGSGTVVSAQSASLGFAVSGEVAELDVQVGDQVTKGQVLAKLGGLDPLQQNVKNQQLAVQTAQKTMEDLLSGASAQISRAAADLASAQSAYADAKANLHQKGDGRCATSKIEEYYFRYLYAQERVDEWEGYLGDPNTGYGHDYILQKLAPMRKERDQAYANWKYCESYTDQEIQTSQANFQLAQAKLEQATQVYQEALASNGINTQDLVITQAALKNAQLQLAQAENNLAGATITAPISGTVMAVTTSVGQTVGTDTIISLADLEHPQVQVNIDETDLVDFTVGCSAQVSFTSLPGQSFSGVVTQVSPTLVTVQNVEVVQGLVDLKDARQPSGKVLPLNLAASVEVTCAQAKNVLQVPVMALVEKNGQSPYVYVLNQQGQPEKREVEVGIKTTAFAEIRSGLHEGEKVITSSIQGE